jgi:DNA repair protein RadD
LCNRKSAIKNLSLKSLAVAWMDDGTLYKKENGGRLYSTAESYSETLYFRDRLKDFGIKSIVKKSNSSSSGKEYYYLVFDKKNIEVLCYMIAPFIHKSMKYKIVQDSWKYVGAYKWDAAYSKFGGAVVESVFNCESDIVYNMEVEGNHTYVITSGRYEKSHKTFNDGIIVHNCHYVNAQKGMYKNFLDNLNGSKVLGLTATPYRLSSNSMGSQLKFLSRTRPRVFDELIYFVQTSVLAKRGYLSKMKYYEVKGVDVSMLKSNSTGADYTDKSLKQHYLSIGFNGLILNVIDRLLAVNRKSILVFTKFIDEAKFVADRCPDAEIVTGSTKKRDRERILNDFKSGKIKVILNVGVLTTGFDFPELETVVLARPTKSLGLYYQMVGRGIRPHPNKPETWVVDLCQNYRRFGRVEDLKISAIKNKLWHVESKGKILTNRILQ